MTSVWERPISAALAKVIATEKEISYAAGLFDGDGCVTVSGRKSRSQKNPLRREIYPTASVSSASRPVLEWLEARWGGHVTGPHVRLAPINLGLAQRDFFGKSRYGWMLSYRQLVVFLTAVLPELKIKDAVARNALALAKYQASRPWATPYTVEEYAKVVAHLERHKKLMEENRTA